MGGEAEAGQFHAKEMGGAEGGRTWILIKALPLLCEGPLAKQRAPGSSRPAPAVGKVPDLRAC